VTDIQIHNASLSHSGTYQCVAQRKDVYRTDRRDVTIQVIRKYILGSAVVKTPPQSVSTLHCRIPAMTKPEIKESSFNQTKKNEVPVGFEFALWCRAHGIPEPKIEWYKVRTNNAVQSTLPRNNEYR